MIVNEKKISKPSLSEVENSLVKLWTDRAARERYLSGDSSGENPGITQADAKGINVYSSLLEIGRNDLMLSVYPYCAKVLKKRWQSTVESYFSIYPPGHFNLNRAASRFSQYLIEKRGDLLATTPWLAELADYEWIELAVLECDSDVRVGARQPLDSPELFQELSPMVNATLLVRTYDYPVPGMVERLQAGKLPSKTLKRKTTFVAAFRHPETNKCTYLELDRGAYELLRAALQGSRTFADLISNFVQADAAGDAQQSVLRALAVFDDLFEHRLFVGTLRLN